MRLAKRHQKNGALYGLLNKAAIVLLMGKFERFLETTMEEFVSIVSAKNLPMSAIPEPIKAHAIDHLFNDEIIQGIRSGKFADYAIRLSRVAEYSRHHALFTTCRKLPLRLRTAWTQAG